MGRETVFKMMEVKGVPIVGTLDAPEKKQDPESVIADLRSIINKKNCIIEQQADYIVDLQEEIRSLRSNIRLLSL